jgi:hypothetical protein
LHNGLIANGSKIESTGPHSEKFAGPLFRKDLRFAGIYFETDGIVLSLKCLIESNGKNSCGVQGWCENGRFRQALHSILTFINEPWPASNTQTLYFL